MGILVSAQSKIIIQGMTGKQGAYHTELMRQYGTNIVSGVSPFSDESEFKGIPLYRSVREAKKNHGGDVSMVFVSSTCALDAVMEAMEAEIPLIICVSKGIPVADVVKMNALSKESSSRLLGPNTMGIILPGKMKVGVMPDDIFLPGSVGIVSRLTSLAYEVSAHLSTMGIGQSAVVGVGEDFVVGTSLLDVVKMFMEDDATDLVLLIGEDGGEMESEVLRWVASYETDKSLFMLLTDEELFAGENMGHAHVILQDMTAITVDKSHLEKEGKVRFVDTVDELVERILELRSDH